MTADARRRILIHPGFHKTGTSSIQHFLWINRDRLAPHVATLQLRHLKPVAQLCMSFARNRKQLVLADLVDLLDDALAEHGPDPAAADTRDLVVSCEALSGHCPGWPGVVDYSAAPFTAIMLAGYFAERFPEAGVVVVYGLREQDSWLRSAWGHHLFGQRETTGFDDWAAVHRAGADLMSVVMDVAAAIDPIQVFTLPIEEARDHPLGPGGALIELVRMPDAARGTLDPVGQGNRGPDDALAAEYLALNRSTLSDRDVKARKADLADASGVGGWTTAPTG